TATRAITRMSMPSLATSCILDIRGMVIRHRSRALRSASRRSDSLRCSPAAASASRPPVLIAQAECQPGLPLVHVRHLVRIAEVLLEAAPPCVAVRVPVEAALRSPVQQIAGRGYEGVRMTGVHDRGIAAGREKASANLIITLDLARDRNTGLELQFCFHVDEDIS